MLDPQIAKAVFNRDGWRCRHCNRGDTIDPHHIIFRSAGGEDTLENLLTLCRKCHDDVHGGRLKIEIDGYYNGNPIIKFWKQKGWKP